MKNLLLLLLSLLTISFGFAQSPTLVKDINTIPTSLGDVEKTITYNGYVYFIQDDGTNGSEVWRTDGATTTMFTNIDNTIYGDPFSLTVWNGGLYFSTTIKGTWKTDGTTIVVFTSARGTIIPAATKLYLQKDRKLYVTDGASEADTLDVLPVEAVDGYQFTTLGDGLFYSGNDPAVYGTELIYEDGIVGTLPVVIDIYPGTDGSFPGSFTVYNNKLHFFAIRYQSPYGTNNDGHSGFKSLFESDGTVNGTTSLVDFSNSGLHERMSSEIGMKVFDNKLFYYNVTGPTNTVDNTVLISYDGTTHTNIHTFTNVNYNNYFKKLYFKAEINGVLYISATHNQTMSSWETDGVTVTASSFNLYSVGPFVVLNNVILFGKDQKLFSKTLAGTETSIYDFSNVKGLLPTKFTTLGGNVFFTATDDFEGSQLWKTDGTAPNTSRITSRGYTNTNGSDPTGFVSQLGNLYFSANDGTGIQLYKTDGTTPNTVVTGDAIGKSGGVIFNGEYYYTLGNNFGDQLWKTDGTTATQIFQVTNKIRNLTVSGSNIFFVTTTTSEGEELWVSDGTVGNKQVLDMATGGTLNTYPQDLVDVDGTLYFTGIDLSKGTRGLWKSDGTFANTSVVFSDDYDISELTKFEDKLYFVLDNLFSGIEPKLYNTTTDDFIAFDLNPNGGSEPYSFREMNGVLYFFTKSPNRALWKSDGTEVGTVLVYTLPTPDYYNQNSYPDQVFASSNKLYFSYNPGYDARHWTYNGTQIDNLSASPYSNSIIIDDMVYFLSYGDLKETDGTDAGTKIIVSKNNGAPSGLNSFNDELYFSYDNALVGRELYKYKSAKQGFALTASSDLNITKNTNIDLTLNWTPGNGAGRIVLISYKEYIPLPVDGVTYTANTVFGASPLGTSTNTFVIGNGASATAGVTELTYGMTYYISIIEYTEPTPGNFIYDRQNILKESYLANKLDQTITLTPIPTKTYGDSEFLVEVTSTSGQVVTFSGVTGPGFYIGNTLYINGAGDIVFNANVAANSTYNAATLQITVPVAKAPLTATVSDITRAYGAANPSLIINYEGFIGNEDETALDVAPVPSTTANVLSNVGEYSITLTTGNDNNYDIINVEGTLTITKAPLAVGVNNSSKTYGDANPSFTFSYSGFVDGEDESVIDTPPTISTTADQTSSAGDYVITSSGGVDDHYDFTYFDGVLTINKAPLTAVINDQERQYGEQNATPTFTYTGFVNDDTEAGIDSPPATTTPATSTSNVGTYPITALDTGSDNNYNIAFPVSGTLTIVKADQSITLDAIADQDYSISNQVFVTSSITSSLEVTLSVTGPATIANGYITLDETPGTVTVFGNQAGDSNYNAATEVSVSFEVFTSDPCFNLEIDTPVIHEDLSVSGTVRLYTDYPDYTNNWYKDDVLYNTNNGELTLTENGVYTVIIENGNGCVSTKSDSYTYSASGINDNIIYDNTNIYPNPTKDILNIESPNFSLKEIRVLDITGKLILIVKSDGIYQHSNGVYQHSINVQDLPKGLYILKIHTEKGFENKRFIID